MTATAPKLAYSRREAAEALGMSLRHFERHVQPEVNFVYCGAKRLVTVRELDRWLERREERGR